MVVSKPTSCHTGLSKHHYRGAHLWPNASTPTPPDIDPAHWTAIGGFVRAAVRDAEAATPYRAHALLGAVTALTHWSWMQGHPLDRVVVFDRWQIEAFVAAGCPATWSPASRGNRRSALFRTSEALLGPEARTPRVAPLPPADPARPYAAGDLIGFRSWATGQRTDARRRDCRVLLALGAGAGIATEDLLSLRATDIDRIDDTFVANVGGRRARRVPLLDSWADLLTGAFVGLGADDFVFRPRRRGAAQNAVSNFLARTTGAAKPSTQRLRATWIVHHLTIGTPVKALMAAAGVQSLATMTRYLRFVPDPVADEAYRWLRGVALQ